jgi:hypothetical protein
VIWPAAAQSLTGGYPLFDAFRSAISQKIDPKISSGQTREPKRTAEKNNQTIDTKQDILEMSRHINILWRYAAVGVVLRISPNSYLRIKIYHPLLDSNSVVSIII